MGYTDVKNRVALAATAAKRNPASIRLIAVSKTKSADAIRDIYQQGQRDFGENYVSELLAKVDELKDLKDLHFVFIGQLQTNKIQKLVGAAAEIQTIASEKHARYVERYVHELNRSKYPVWIHVNAGGEAQKFGVSPTEAADIAAFIKSSCPHLELQGIMTIPPVEYSDAATQDNVPTLYTELVQLARKVGLGKISLGMTGDLNIAVASGSDCVRIGTAIFGARTP